MDMSMPPLLCFNSRTPGGVRPNLWTWRRHATRVSIHAPREGCDDISEVVTTALTVSIHAPREGCDSRRAIAGVVVRSFNSRTPGGVRRCRPIARPGIGMFQFTHPGRGATLNFSGGEDNRLVSIHAPREGCDSNRSCRAPCSPSFNSRTPGGVRLESALHQAQDTTFQFTHPGRGATA